MGDHPPVCGEDSCQKERMGASTHAWMEGKRGGSQCAPAQQRGGHGPRISVRQPDWALHPPNTYRALRRELLDEVERAPLHALTLRRARVQVGGREEGTENTRMEWGGESVAPRKASWVSLMRRTMKKKSTTASEDAARTLPWHQGSPEAAHSETK